MTNKWNIYKYYINRTKFETSEKKFDYALYDVQYFYRLSNIFNTSDLKNTRKTIMIVIIRTHASAIEPHNGRFDVFNQKKLKKLSAAHEQIDISNSNEWFSTG